MFEQQQRVRLDTVFDRQFRFLLDCECCFVIDASEALDQKPVSHDGNQIVTFERHSISRVGLWYNHPSNRKMTVYLRTAAEEKPHLETSNYHFIGPHSFGSLYGVLTNAQTVQRAKAVDDNDRRSACRAGANAGGDPRGRPDQESEQVHVPAGRSDQQYCRG